MGKRLSLEDKAKIANGNERHCRQCNHRVCPDGLLEVCSEAFIRGYKKGYKQHIQGEHIAHIGQRHTLLDVSRIRLRTDKRGGDAQDELDLDAVVVSLRNIGTDVSWMEMATVA